MTIALGIDTGGTYTDAVLLAQPGDQVLATAKSLTTHHDLSLGITAAITAVFEHPGHEIRPQAVDMVSLSTTLATNAIVEGQGSPICLILIGYSPDLIRKFGFEKELGTANVVYVAGGHDILGIEAAPLDEEALIRTITAQRDQVEAFAISGYFGVRNPAHELRARQLVQELTASDEHDPLPVTCGHELSTRLNSVRRATTVALNARLIPLLIDLISTVQAALNQQGVSAPLMVVKGDGSLVRAGWAMDRPIETILSGPAASVIGAWRLAGEKDVWVVDMGGTTTDIASLQNGLPRVNPDGARVGRWQTMVEAIDVFTVGLGGDSDVRACRRTQRYDPLAIGPRRVMPLSLLAYQYPQITAKLRAQLAEPEPGDESGRLVLAQRKHLRHLSEAEAELVAQLQAGPQTMHDVLGHYRVTAPALRRMERLIDERKLILSAFTPTDALHVLGLLAVWDTEAARLGAELLARQLHLDVQTLCEHVLLGVSSRIAQALVSKTLLDDGIIPQWDQDPTAAELLARALYQPQAVDLDSSITLRRPVIGIGAPAAAFMPRTGAQLHTHVTIPEHAEVANAIGAVVGSVVQHRTVEIQPVEIRLRARFRSYLPDGIHDFATLGECVRFAEAATRQTIIAQARQAGAQQVEVRMQRLDHSAPVQEAFGGELYLGTDLIFTAVGRPSLRAEGNSGQPYLSGSPGGLNDDPREI